VISLWQMTVIREIMRAGSVSEAARNLGRTQPALSAVVKEMEKRLDFRLFEREQGRLTPAPETYFLLERADEIITQVEDLEQMMKSGGDASAARITVASMPVLSEHFLPAVIAAFARQHPKARFHLAVQGSPEVMVAMEAQRFDVGLAERGQTTNLLQCRQFEVPCVCALPGDDPLLAKKVITPRDLAGRTCASFLPEHHIAQAMHMAFDEAGVKLDPKFEMQNGAAQYEIVGVGADFGLFSPLNAWIHRRLWPGSTRLAFRRFTPEITYQFSIITPKRRPLSRLANAFSTLLEQSVITMLDEAEKLIDGEAR
jgi:DNA-binding transcriptional LysR family regulator